MPHGAGDRQPGELLKHSRVKKRDEDISGLHRSTTANNQDWGANEKGAPEADNRAVEESEDADIIEVAPELREEGPLRASTPISPCPGHPCSVGSLLRPNADAGASDRGGSGPKEHCRDPGTTSEYAGAGRHGPCANASIYGGVDTHCRTRGHFETVPNPGADINTAANIRIPDASRRPVALEPARHRDHRLRALRR